MRGLISILMLGAAMGAKPSEKEGPPGQEYLLTIQGENTITFVPLPQGRLDPLKIDYEAEISYFVDTRTAEDEKAGDTAKKKKPATRKSNSNVGKSRAEPTVTATSALDVLIHSANSRFRQNGTVMLESKISRASFQGRLLPDAPVVGVTANNAPPQLQAILRTFDAPIAVILLDDEMNVVNRKVRENVPLHAVAETLLSLHTPVPRGRVRGTLPRNSRWDTGRPPKGRCTSKGRKESLEKTGGMVNVKVSGVLKAEGAIAGKLIKDGTYTVTGEQAYDAKSRAGKPRTGRSSSTMNSPLLAV